MSPTLAVIAAVLTLCKVLGLGGCEQVAAMKEPEIKGTTAEVIISGKLYTLEIAADPATRMRGLGGRTEIPERGGMIFAFPYREVQVQNFVMRDCPIDIDIIYTDGVGRILAMHEMKADPRRPGEGEPGDINIDTLTGARREGAIAYEMRLKRYSSKFPASFAIELRAGSIRTLGVKEGDIVRMDHAGLKKLAK